MTDEPPLKPVVWVGTSRKDLPEFPEPVQDHVGYALYVAQRGGKHRDAKALSGFGGAGVVEVVSDYRGDTFRAVYQAAAKLIFAAEKEPQGLKPRRIFNVLRHD